MDPRPQNRPTLRDQDPSDVRGARDEAEQDGLDRADGEPRRRRSRYHAVRRRNRARDARAAEERAAEEEARKPALGATPVAPPNDPRAVDAARTAGGVPQDAIDAPEDSIPPEEAGKARPGHPAESPRGFGRFVTIAALVILAIIVWVVLF
jgi:hypothetical protein